MNCASYFINLSYNLYSSSRYFRYHDFCSQMKKPRLRDVKWRKSKVLELHMARPTDKPKSVQISLRLASYHPICFPTELYWLIMILETRVFLLQFFFVWKLMALIHSRDYHNWNQITILNQYPFSYILIWQSISNLSLPVRRRARNVLFNLSNIFKYLEYTRCPPHFKIYK